MGISASWVITRFSEMTAGGVVSVLLEVDGIELCGW